MDWSKVCGVVGMRVKKEEDHTSPNPFSTVAYKLMITQPITATRQAHSSMNTLGSNSTNAKTIATPSPLNHCSFPD
jgi:hypothetical protein